MLVDDQVDRDFPALLIYFNEEMQPLDTERLDGPGVLKLPDFDEPVGVQIRFADGQLQVVPPVPAHINETKNNDAYTAWRAQLCGMADPVSGVAGCWESRYHEGPCRLRYIAFTGGEAQPQTVVFEPYDLAVLLGNAHQLISSNSLGIWTVYDHPLDFPEHFVARLHLVVAGRSVPTDRVIVKSTLDEVREELPQGLTCMARSPSDDPNIVESWL